MSGLRRRYADKEKALDRYLDQVAVWLSKRLPLSDYKKAKLKADIETAGEMTTPELYVAKGIVKAGFIGLFAIPFLFVFPVGAAVIAAIAVVTYTKESKRLSEKIDARRQKIEMELPRLVANIEKTIQHSRDVLSILESYKEVAGPELKEELAIAVADMRSGNYEIALSRLESRVGSSLMSDVTRGLIGVIRGDNTDAYWATISIKFSDYQRQMLKDKAAKIPKKVRKLSICLLGCFMLIYMVVIAISLVDSLGGVFG